MDAIHIQYNPQILMLHWNTMRRHDSSKYIVGATKLITYGKQRKEIGEAQIVGLTVIQFGTISNMIATAITGKPAHYMKAILQKMYPGIQPHDLLDMITLQWTQRYLVEQEDLVKQWWDSQVAQTPNYHEYKLKQAV